MGKDVYYHLPRILSRINCKRIDLVFGNHDDKIRKSAQLMALFSSCQDYMELRVNGTLVVISHYALAVWKENGKGSIMLHGHSHGSYSGQGRIMDIGVDCTGFKPILLEDAVNICLQKPIDVVDHHGANTSYD